MIGLDSSVLVRYFAQDDPVQSPKANTLIERRLSERAPGFVSLVVMAETVWVLRRIYKFPADKLATAIERILENDTLVVEQRQDVFFAAVAFSEGADFSDALIASLGLRAGCSHTLTFDKKASRLPGFELLA